MPEDIYPSEGASKVGGACIDRDTQSASELRKSLKRPMPLTTKDAIMRDSEVGEEKNEILE